MPGLIEPIEICCLICGSKQKCQQVTTIPNNEGEHKWAHYFCDLLRLDEALDLKETLDQGFYCPSCYSKIRSIAITSGLIETMKKRLTEMKGSTEDELLLSNFENQSSDETIEPFEKTQRHLRQQLMDALEKRKPEIPLTKVDKSIECLILPEAPPPPPPVVVPNNKDQVEGEEEDLMDTINESKKHLVKIRLPSNITKDVLESLMKQSANKSGEDAGQLIIQGFVERSSCGTTPKQTSNSPSLEVMGNNVSPAFIEFENQTTAITNSPKLKSPKSNNENNKRKMNAGVMMMGSNDNNSSSSSKCINNDTDFSNSVPQKKKKLMIKKKVVPTTVPCSLCDENFKSILDLSQHMEMHKDSNGYITCPKCPIKVNSAQAFAHHQENKHEKVHSCQICAKAFTIAGLKRHIKAVHQNEQNTNNHNNNNNIPSNVHQAPRGKMSSSSSAQVHKTSQQRLKPSSGSRFVVDEQTALAPNVVHSFSRNLKTSKKVELIQKIKKKSPHLQNAFPIRNSKIEDGKVGFNPTSLTTTTRQSSRIKRKTTPLNW